MIESTSKDHSDLIPKLTSQEPVTTGKNYRILFKTAAVATVAFAGLAIAAKTMSYQFTFTVISVLVGITLIIAILARGYFKWQQKFADVADKAPIAPKPTIAPPSSTPAKPAGKSRLLTEELPKNETKSTTIPKSEIKPPVPKRFDPTTLPTVTSTKPEDKKPSDGNPFKALYPQLPTPPDSLQTTKTDLVAATTAKLTESKSESSTPKPSATPKTTSPTIQTQLGEYTDAEGIIHQIVRKTNDDFELECEYVKGLREGPSKATVKKTGDKLYAWFVNDMREGDAIEHLKDGTRIICTFKNGDRQGYAVKIHPNNEIEEITYVKGTEVKGKEQEKENPAVALPKSNKKTENGFLLSYENTGHSQGKAVEVIGNTVITFEFVAGMRFGTAKAYNLETLVITEFKYDNNDREGDATEKTSEGMTTYFKYVKNLREGSATIIQRDGKIHGILYKKGVIVKAETEKKSSPAILDKKEGATPSAPLSTDPLNGLKVKKIESSEEFDSLFKDFNFENDFEDINPYTFEAKGAVYTYTEKNGRKVGKTTLTFMSGVSISWFHQNKGAAYKMFEKRLPDETVIRYTRTKDVADQHFKPNGEASETLKDKTLIKFKYDMGVRHGDATKRNAKGEITSFKYNKGVSEDLPKTE